MSGDVTVVFFGGPKNGETMVLASPPNRGLKVPKKWTCYHLNKPSDNYTTGHYGPIVVDSGFYTTKAGHIVLYWCGWEDDQ